uniref:WD repeat and FYVE domain-containing protein 3 n=1 Tax=Cajanus cajan TaxID=3821 RepID=A0A151S1D8_CAJCA|nr:WD repeat and FYVE domain-containing protein 3 [Cajanus cajan]
MKWVTLLKDIKEKVGLTQSPSSATPSASPPPPSSSSRDNNVFSASQSSAPSPSRDKYELELDFKRFWEEFRSSSSEKEKEAALNLSIDAFCRLVKQHSNVAQLVTMLVETHIFSFVVGRAFVTDIEKLKISSKTRSLDVAQVLKFFSEVTKDGISPGANLLTSVGILVSGPIDKQSLLDSGIFCCLIQVLNALLNPDVNIRRPNSAIDHEEKLILQKDYDGEVGQNRRHEVEGSVVHIMKALASHPSAAQSLIEDDSLQLLFQMVAKGSLIVFSRYKEGLIPLHSIQLHRHAMQILGLLLVNDNGSTAKYIRKHHLIKVLLLAVKDFDPDCGDAAYTVGIVDLLLKCVELSYRAEAAGVRLREDIHNGHGYQFLVQFTLNLSNMTKNQGFQSTHSETFDDQDIALDGSQNSRGQNSNEQEQSSIQYLSPTLSRLLDVLVSLAQTGPNESAHTYGGKGSKSIQNKGGGHSKSRTLSSDWLGDELWEKENDKIKDLEAVQMIQDILLKANSWKLQAEVLNRLFKIFSGHIENYKLCQQLRTVPLLILNMAGFPSNLQEIILKILEYAVTVVNCVPEQELLSLCCLLQQPITSTLKQTILSFFVKLLSFDQQYKKVLREVGVLEVMLDDLKQHRILGPEQQNFNPDLLERKNSPSNFKKHMDNKDVIITSPKFMESGSGKFPIFDVEDTIAIAWDCMVSLLKKAEANQASFRLASGVTAILPFLVSDVHRSGVLRILSCLIIEDTSQVHPEELGVLVEILKSGMVTGASGSQYRLSLDAKCDTMGALWRVLGVNNSAQKVFGEATGFSLLLTTLHGFQSDGGDLDQSSLNVYIKVFTYLLRVVTAGVSDNAVNRMKLHAIISSQTFIELLSDPSGPINPDKERVYNAGAVRVLIRSLLLFTPMVQLQLLDLIEKLARAGPFNQESLTSIGCVELLLETIHPFLLGSSSLLSYALKIVEVLGSYRLSASELRMLLRYVLQMRMKNSGHIIVEMMEKLILTGDMASENISLAPFVEMDMSNIGHAAIQVSLGERSWPPAAGYSFVCWFQFRNFLKSQSKESDISKFASSKKRSGSSGLHERHILRIFSVGATNNDNATYAELYLQEDGVLTLATSNSSFLSFSGLELEEGRWHHLAEVLTPGCICFMYILGRGYRGLFQDTDLLQFVPNQACGGGSMAILDSLDADSTLAANGQRLDVTSKQGDLKADGSGIVWDLERLGNLSLQLSGKKLIFAFDGTSTEFIRSSGSFSMLNLVDPMSAAASPIGGIPRFGRLCGDIYICKQGVIGETIRPIGGMELVLALVEAAETRDMLHMALTLLACALHQNPQNLKDMQTYRGYHLLALFLRRRMSLFDMQSLEIFFQIAACEASFSEPKKFEITHTTLSPSASLPETSIEDHFLSKFNDDNSSIGTHGDMDDFSVQKDSFSHISELENTDVAAETSNCIVLSNADMVEHVLLDWTLWVTAPVSIQIALLGFLENLVSMHWYRNHNLTILRRINLVQHLLVTLQRGDVEVPVLEKLVVLLGVILEDGFLSSELENVVRFVIMTFDPPGLTPQRPILRESMGKHVIVRNMLLEMFIDLQVTIKSEELLEQWHKVVSSKLITYFLDEAVHPTSMRWVMTLLGVCLTSSPTFALKFRTGGGYQGLVRVLPSFYDSPDIYYILFCLIFGKPVYPRLPEVRMLDFHALMPSDGSITELKFVELLDSVIAMAKTTFDRVSMQSMLAHQTGNLSQFGASLVAELVEGNSDMAGELQGEALMHKTYAARLMGGEASAPAAATSVLRFMVDLAKMCPPFTAVCRRAEFLESCIDLYFSCVRAAHAVKMAKELSAVTEEKTLNDCDDTCSSHNTFSSLPLDQDQSVKTSISVGSFPQGQVSTSSDDMAAPSNTLAGERSQTNLTVSELEPNKSIHEDMQTVQSLDGDNADQGSVASSAHEFTFHSIKGNLEILQLTDSQSSASFAALDSPDFSEKSSSRIPLTPSSTPVVALTSWLGSANHNEAKSPLTATPSFDSSMSAVEFDSSSNPKSSSQVPSSENAYFTVTSKLLLDIDDSGYGGGPCSAGATAVLDFIAEVLSDFVTEQVKASQLIENILESVPLCVDGVRIKGMEGRRKKEMGRKSREAAKLDLRHWEQVNERRYALDLVRDAMSTELRVVRQDKYGWILHAESEWQCHLQQLVHERGIFPLSKSSFTEEPEWQLCPIEGPYRMRKKLECCKPKIDTIQNILDGQFELDKPELSKGKIENGPDASESKPYFQLLTDGGKQNGSDASLHSALELGAKSSAISVPIEESTLGRSDMGSPRQFSSTRTDDVKIADDKSDKELHDNGEYLIRPFLEPFEKIRFKYNCERVMGLDKHDGIFLIGEFCLYVIENFYIDDSGCFCEKECEDELSVIDQALGKIHNGGNLPHPWRMWKLDSVHEILKRDYQLRPVAIEIFSMDGCNDLLVFHKKEREEVFKNLVAINLPRNSMLDTTISGSSKQESNEGSRLFKIMAKSFSKRWQNGEISNFQYLMHLNTLAGRGYSDLTQYPVFPWVLADYESENLDFSNPKTFRRLDKPMGCQTPEGEDEFKKRYESWDDPEVPKFHYGSHYSSAGIVLFYLLRLPPFSTENQKLQGGQFDHADRLFNSVRDTWLSAAGKGNTSDVKELIPEFYYMPEFLENRFNLDLGEKQSGEKVGDVILPQWAKGSAREFINKHREALESDYVSENLHHWIDLIFGYKQRGKAAEESVNVFYHYTYEGSVDIDSVTDPAMKASILAQINHFGQTPKQLFLKPHVKRRTDRKLPPHPLKHSSHLAAHEIRKSSSPITQIVTHNDKVLIAGTNHLLKPRTYTKYVAWGFPDRSLRFMSYEQDKLLSTHENLHGGNQVQCASVSHDGQILVTGGDDGLVNVWRVSKFGPRALRHLKLQKPLCGHTAKITCLQVSQPYMLIVSGSDDCTVIIWDLSSMAFVRQLPEFTAPVSAVSVNDLTGEIVTAAGILLAVWSINGDCLAMIRASQLPSDSILSVTSSTFSDWLDTKWYATGHQSGAVKVWQMVHCSNPDSSLSKFGSSGINLGAKEPEYKLVLRKVLKFHKHPVTALHLTTDLKQFLSGDSDGHLLSWTLPDESLRGSLNQG